MSEELPTVLVVGATSKIGQPLIEELSKQTGTPDVRVIAATRNADKAKQFEAKGVETRILDLDRAARFGLDKTVNALAGIERLFLLTGYDVNMLAHSKAAIDAAVKNGVKHIVHVGAYATEGTTIVHLGLHLFIEKYIETSGLGWTHLRPNVFMQNLLAFGGKNNSSPGVIEWYTGNAPLSWIDCTDIAAVAAEVLRRPENFNRQKIPLAVDRASMPEIAEIFSDVIGKPFVYQAREPAEFTQKMFALGFDPAYIRCVENVLVRQGEQSLTEAADTFKNFEKITGRKPTLIRDFIAKYKEFLGY